MGCPAMLSAVLAYLDAVFCDPGFLYPSGRRPPSVGRFGVICAVCSFPLVLILRCRRRAAAREVDGADLKLRTETSKRSRAEELRPIGHSALAGLQFDLDGDTSDVDPGEEVLELKDLEVGALPPTAHAQDSAVYRRESTLQPVEPGPRLRWCNVCKIHQPLRSKHCRDCERCVRTHDHHCPWIGTCVGEGNRSRFYIFLIAQLVELIVAAAEGGLFFLRAPRKQSGLFGRAVLVGGLTIILLFVIMVFCLLVFHTYLALANITTWESMSWFRISYLKELRVEKGSPFSSTVQGNLAIYFRSDCRRVRRTPDGWAIWELGPQKNIGEMDIVLLGHKFQMNLCSCFLGG